MEKETWLIDANKLIDDLKTFKGLGATMAETLVRFVKKQPTVDAMEVVHGRWVICSDGYYPYCSECKEEPKHGEMTKYCPNCGAKMDGGTADGKRINL